MKKLHFSILINATQEKVWNIMLSDKTYREWTTAFIEGSYFEGKWEAGSIMKFLALDESGSASGMLSVIKEVRPYNFVSIQNIGEIAGTQETLFTDEQTEGQDMLENYTFAPHGDATELSVDMDTPDSMSEMFNGMWPKALQKLKETVENK